MKSSLEALAQKPADDVYDTPEFRTIIEDHLTWLINHPSTFNLPVSAHHIEVYDFDWIGLLTNLKVATDLHFIVIRMNGGTSLNDVPQDLRSLKIPNYNVIQNLTILNNGIKKIQ